MEKESNKNCEICELNSTCLCFKCNFYFCEKCYKLVHDLKKSNQEHKKEVIDPFISFDLKCRIHKDQKNSLFCTNDKGKSFIIKSIINI